LHSVDCECALSDVFNVFVESTFVISVFDDLARLAAVELECGFLEETVF